ncbi:MAG TPA: hypothetical protein VKE40_27965 [Gemmataceae bacterium]|nr:hypothetical protein [Gemmataceae bacterium]
MSKVNEVPQARFTRFALWVTLILGLLATVAAALPVGPVPGRAPVTEIAPVDSVGIDVLEPANAAQSAAPVPPQIGNLERQVQTWTPTGTGGGTGVHGSPKG